MPQCWDEAVLGVVTRGEGEEIQEKQTQEVKN